MKYIQIKKIIFGLTMYLIIFFGFFHGITYVHGATCVSSNTIYCLLSPLPGLGDSVDTQTGVGNYINTMIRIVIGFMSVLAVVMFVIGGIQYMVSNMVGEKASAKDRMVNAVFGLILALSSYLILNTLNPKLVNLKIGIQGVAIREFFDNTIAGQDGYNVGKDAGATTRGNEVVGGLDNHTVTSGDLTYLVPVTRADLDYFACANSCVFDNSTRSDLKLDKSIVSTLKKVFASWRTLKESDKIKYSYQVSSIIGFKMSSPNGSNVLQSPHTFGIAVNLIPDPPQELVQIFKENGFSWGGDVTPPNKPDLGYFSKLRDEGASGGDSFRRVTNP